MAKKHLPLFIFLLVVAAFFAFATPKKLLASVNHLVISQIQITGTTATDEFVEIYNPTGELVNLTGYRLTKKVDSGTQSTLMASMSGTISPNQHYLIKHPTGYTSTTIADSQYSTATSITADNIVILYSDAGITVVDKVGFGAPFDSETQPFSPNPTAGQSLRRINNQDSDNNSVDFELLQTASPRNSSTISATPVQTPTPLATETPTPEPTPTPVQTQTPTPLATPTPTTNSIETPTPSLTPTAIPVATPSPTPKTHHNSAYYDKEIKLPFGFRCKVEKHEFKFRHHSFKYFKLNFHRR